MATKTLNFQLIKPAGEDLYNVEDFNKNFDAIDTQMKKNADGITAINEAGYQKADDVMNAITAELGKLTKLDIQVVDDLPAKGVVGTFYFKRASRTEEGNNYEEYIWIEKDSKYEMIGTKTIDLSQYVDISTDQEIGGNKTFTNPVKVPEPLVDEDAANKKYLEESLKNLKMPVYFTDKGTQENPIILDELEIGIHVLKLKDSEKTIYFKISTSETVVKESGPINNLIEVCKKYNDSEINEVFAYYLSVHDYEINQYSLSKIENGYNRGNAHVFSLARIDFSNRFVKENYFNKAVTCEEDPTEDSHLTTKHYVDKAISDMVISGGGGIQEEEDPTVPSYVKSISEQDISNWNNKQEAGDYALKSQLPDLSGYYTGNQVDTKIAQAIAGTHNIKTEIVTQISDVKDANTIYLILAESSETNNIYDEYMFVNGKAEKIGSTKIDLSGYALTSEVDKKLQDYVKTTTLGNYSTTSAMNTAIQNAINKLNISVENKKDTSKVKIVLSDTQPAEESGVITLWVDTSV